MYNGLHKKRIWQKRKINVAGIDSPKKRKHKSLMRGILESTHTLGLHPTSINYGTEILHDIVTQELSNKHNNLGAIM